MAPKQKEEGKEGLSITIWAGGALRDMEETRRIGALRSRSNPVAKEVRAEAEMYG